MKIKFINIFFLLFASFRLDAQDSVVFRDFTLLHFTYSAPEVISSTDSFLTKRYTLINEEGDSLFLLQKLPFHMVSGEIKVYEMGLTDRFTHMREDSSYTIIFSKDKFGLLKSSEYVKHRKIDFLFQNTKGIRLSSTDKTNPLVLQGIIQIAKPPVSKKVSYFQALNSLQYLIQDSSDQKTFKEAVFIVENAFVGNEIPYKVFDRRIDEMATAINLLIRNIAVGRYKFSDSVNFLKNYAIYHFLKDSTQWDINGVKITHLPYTYDFEDFSGYKDWSNMFVSKLLITHKGNCHSLPYLYKILADEMGTSCWLTLAPNHIYISNRCRKIGWYNTELTSGDFPIDAWIMASGYLPLKAVQSGIYMDTLSNQQSIALCVLDLAKGYEHKTRNYYDGFILKCCNLSLEYFPLNVQAILLKAETLKRIYEKQVKGNDAASSQTYAEMEKLYGTLFDLGYREMPDEMYAQWLKSVVKERDKYSNKEVKAALSNN